MMATAMVLDRGEPVDVAQRPKLHFNFTEAGALTRGE
jgi:hypothetical protein